jgi:GPH family glycoside/pentoside/hexuronide:cation symporter
MAAPAKPAVQKLALMLCLGWGIGSAGMAAMNLSRSLNLRFMTVFLEIAAVTAGLLFAISKLFDAVTDPVMGFVLDRRGHAASNRSVFVLIGALTCPLAYLMIFRVPGFVTADLVPVYMLGVMLFFAASFTLFSVPYLTMPVDIARDYHQRNFLLSFRAFGIAVGGLVGGLLAPLVIASHGRTREAHEIMAVAVAGMIFLFLFLSWLATRKVQRTIVGRDTLPLWEKLRLLWGNRHFFLLLIAKFVFYTGVSMLNASGAFFIQYALGASDRLIALFYLCFFVSVVLSQPLWLKAGKRWSKHAVYIGLCFLLAAVNLTWLAATPEETNAMFVLRACLIGACFGGIIVMGQSMLPDTMEFDRNRSGRNREGLFAGFFSFAEKSASALGIALVGLVLGLMGYRESSDRVVVDQADSAITAIYLCFSVAPAVFMIISAAVMSVYRLTETTLLKSRDTDVLADH